MVMNDVFWISFGAIFGANLRYFVNRLSLKYLSPSFPYGTLIVNITGSFIIGFFLAWILEKVMIDPKWRLMIAIGFCGSYTTFSTFSYEIYSLLEKSAYELAIMNFISNNLLSISACILGIALARAL
jgi:CrcB protein